MITNISTNNLDKVTEAIKKYNFECIFLVDYAANLQAFLEYLVSIETSPKEIFFFTEHQPNLTNHDAFSNVELTLKPWSLNRYLQFLFSCNRVSFENHQPVYSDDISRLSQWRLRYAMGPFKNISRKIHRTFSNTLICSFCDLIIACMGLLCMIVIPQLRQKSGKATCTYKEMKVSIYFDGGPETDHYGESPIIEDKIFQFVQITKQQLQKPNEKTGFFIAAGPRHEYLEHIFELEDADIISNFAVFVRGLFRPKAYAVTKRRNTGFFSEGTNISSAGKTVYSEHCLSIGAGQKELWHYININENND